MADRTWNPVDARLYEELWSKEARLLMGVIIARCPNPYGVYEFRDRTLYSLFIEPEVEKALDELVNLKKPPIKLYRDREVVWIVSKWKRAGAPNANQQKGAMNAIMSGYQEVWEDFKGVYKGFLRGLNGVQMGFGEVPSDTESDSESDTESENKTSLFDEKYYGLTRELALKIKRFSSIKGEKIEKHVEALAIIDRNGHKRDDDLKQAYSWELLRDALLWAAEDDFHSQNLRSCTNLKTTWKNGLPKWLNICIDFLDRYEHKYGPYEKRSEDSAKKELGVGGMIVGHGGEDGIIKAE